MQGSTRIEGSVALVTGANRGIGLAITEALLERGAAKVYATARDPKTLEALHERYGSRLVPLRRYGSSRVGSVRCITRVPTSSGPVGA